MKVDVSRRAFLRGATLAGLAAAGGCRTCGSAGAVTVGGLSIGVQMWSVDKLWKQDPADAFRRLRALGYTGVQSFGFYAMDWNELAKMFDGEGLKIVDMPFYLKTLENGGEAKFLDFCARFGIDFVYEPYIRLPTAAAWRDHAAALGEIAARFAAKGIRTGYHNHQHELRERVDGQRPLDILRDAGLAFELDVGHVKLAGDDPVAWLDSLAGRVPTIHAKPGGGNAVGGAGDANDWPAIFRAARAAGARWAVVECETRRDTYEDVAASMAFLKGLNV